MKYVRLSLYKHNIITTKNIGDWFLVLVVISRDQNDITLTNYATFKVYIKLIFNKIFVYLMFRFGIILLMMFFTLPILSTYCAHETVAYGIWL